MPIPTIQTAFSKGEIAPSLFGRTDVAPYHTAASTMRNMFCNYRGGAYSRAGTKFIAPSFQSVSGAKPRLIPFQFSVSQGYALEFGELYMRVFSQGGLVLNNAKNITGASGNILTVAAHGYVNGTGIYTSGTGTAYDGQYLIIVAVTTNTFALNTFFGVPANFSAWTGGGTAASVFTISTPYHAVDLPLLKFVQSADVMSLTHPNYSPYELSRLAGNNWVLAPLSIAAPISAPGTITANANNTSIPAGQQAATFAYCVTSIDVNGHEGFASNVANCTGVDIALTGGSNTVAWSAVSGAVSYNIYRAPISYGSGIGVPVGSSFGYAGTAYGTSWVDSNVVPDFSQTPPLFRNPLAPGQILYLTVTSSNPGFSSNPTITINTSTGANWAGTPVIVSGVLTAIITVVGGAGYIDGVDTVTISGGGGTATATLKASPNSGANPSVVAYYQQRRVYANSPNQPDTMWFSQPGNFNNFDLHDPVIDSDAITAAPWAEQVNGIQWMIQVPSGLITFTGKAAWQVTAAGSVGTSPQPLTPSSIQAQPQAFNGCNPQVQPIKINYDILYVQALGSVVRDLTYQFWQNIYTGTDITVWNSHLFTGHQIVEWAWCEEPFKVVWAVREDGQLLSLTYIKEQEFVGWTRHDTAGSVLSVCAVSEPPVNALYMVVQRTINGQLVNYIERMENRLWVTPEDPWCVDCGTSIPFSLPNMNMIAGNGTGTAANSVTFTTSSTFFNSGNVGLVIRMANGVAVMDTYVSATQMTGHWTILPSPGVFLSQGAGNWSASVTFTSITAAQLPGMTVYGLADGIPIGPIVLNSNGTGALPFAASNIKIGFGFTAQLQSVYLDEGQPTIQGRRKLVNAATIRVDASYGFQVGANQPDGSVQSPPTGIASWSNLATPPLQGAAFRTFPTPSGQTGILPFTGDVRVPVASSWQKQGQVAVQQNLPLPLNITAIVAEYLPGDTPEALIESRPQRGPAA